MNTPLKISLAVTGVVVVLLVTAIVTITNIDPNNHKPWIADQFRAQTGRELSLGGEIGLSLYPWLGISIKDVAISNAEGFGEQPMFAAEEAELRIKLLPILSQHYEIDTIKLYGARINLAVNADGRNNWSDLMGSGDNGESGGSAETGGSFPLGNIILCGVDVHNASLQLDDRAADVRYDISQFSFKTDALVYGEPIALNISMQAAATRPELTADVTLGGTLYYDLDNGRYELAPLQLHTLLRGANLPNGSADITLNTEVRVDLDADTLSMPELTLAALGSELHASVRGQNVTSANAIYDVTLQLTGNDLALLFKVAEIEPLATQLAGLSNRSFEFNTTATLDSGRDTANIPTLQASLLGTSIDGSLQAANVRGGSPSVTGKLLASGPDLPTVVEVMGQISGGRNSSLSQAGRELRQVSNKSFAIDAAFDANLATGNVNVPTLDLHLLGATINGNVVANNIQTDKPLLRGKLQASGPDLPTLVEVAGLVAGGRNSPLSQAGRDLRQVSDKSFSVIADFDANLSTGNVTVPTLDVRLLGATITGNLLASNIQTDKPVLKGKLDAAGPDLPLLLQIGGRFQGADSPLLETANKLTGLSNKAFTVNAEFDADLQSGNINVPNIAAGSLGFQLNGKVTSRDFSGRNGNIDGNFMLTGQNLRQLLTALDQKDLGEVLQSVSLQVGLSGSRTALAVSPLTASVVVAGSRIQNSPATIALNASSKLNLDQESLVVENFAVTGLGLNTTGNVTATKLFDAPTFDGKVNVASFNLRHLLQQLNQSLPEMADNRTLEAVSLGTSFSGSQSSIRMNEIVLGLDQTHLRGHLSVENFAKPNVIFDINITELDADRYLAPSSSPAASTSNADATSEIPVQMLRDLSLKGKLAVTKLTISGLQLADVAMEVNASDGNVVIAPVRTNLYQGSFIGSLGLDASGPITVANVDANLQTVALEPLMMDFMDASYVSGRGNVRFIVSARGNDTKALKTSLTGSGNIALEDGVLTGVDVAGVLGQVETMLRSRRVAELQRGEKTAFETFTATLAINNGVVASNDLLIKSPGIQIAGRGTLVDLNTDAIGYNMVTSVDKSTATRNTKEYDIGGYSVPIACTGTIHSPRCLPDAGEIMRSAVSREAERRVGDLIQRTLGTGTGTATDAQQPAQTSDGAATADQTQQAAPVSPADQLINRALNRILN